MHDLNRKSGFAVQPRDTFGIFIGAPHFGNVFEVHNAIADSLDRHVKHILGTLKNSGYFDGKSTCAGMQGAGRNKSIVARDKTNDLRLVQTITFHCQRIDDDFHEFFARADKIDFKDATQGFQFFLEVPGDSREHPLRHVAGEVQYEHWVEARHLDFVDGRFICITGQLRLGFVDLLSYILQCFVRIDARVKLQLHICATFVRVSGHFLDAFDRTQFLLHGPHEQSFRVFRGDSVVRDAHINDRDFDIRLGFFRDRRIGDHAADQDDQQ